MSQTLNLPVFQTELVDGGLTINTSNIIGDVIVVIGFSAQNTTYPDYPLVNPDPNSNTEILVGGQYAVQSDLYINQPIRITQGAEADYVYGYSYNGSSVSKAIYEAIQGGATTTFVMNLGSWGTAYYVDDLTGIKTPIFTATNVTDQLNNHYNVYSINKAGYYLALQKAYELLKNFNADIIYPVDAFAFDVVGVSGAYTGINTANLPGMTVASGSDASGVIHRPTTFAYQMASELYDMSSQNNECLGVINVSGSPSATLASVATYLGTTPTYGNAFSFKTIGITTFPTIASGGNGTGLLGVPFQVGASGTPWDGVLPGYFESNFNPETDLRYGYPPQQVSELLLDRKGNPVDIGRYISILAEEPTFNNGSQAGNYNGLAGAVYAGLISQLVPQSSPTNKVVPNIVGLRYFKSLAQLDNLVGARYTTFRNTVQGIKVTDAPTASLATSDYNRLSTVRIVNAVMKMIRQAAEPFIGEAATDAMKNALNSAITKLLNTFVAQGALSQFNFTIQQSTSDAVLGNMTIYLTLVPVFEIRKIRAVVVLAPNL